MLFDWFDVTEVTAFAKSVAAEYGRLRKSTVVRMDNADKRTQRFEKLTRKVVQFAKTKRLNFYKKAKMMSEIKFGLRSQGIPELEISTFVSTLLLGRN